MQGTAMMIVLLKGGSMGKVMTFSLRLFSISSGKTLIPSPFSTMDMTVYGSVADTFLLGISPYRR